MSHRCAGALGVRLDFRLAAMNCLQTRRQFWVNLDVVYPSNHLSVSLHPLRGELHSGRAVSHLW